MSSAAATSVVEHPQAALAQFAAVTDAQQRPGFPIAADLKRQRYFITGLGSVSRPNST